MLTPAKHTISAASQLGGGQLTRNRKIRAEIIVFDDVFEVFQTCENLYYASWTHVTSLERL